MQMDLAAAAPPGAAFQRLLMTQLVVAEMMGVTLRDLCRATRGNRQVAFARQSAMYLCHAVHGMGINDIARAFGRDRSTVCHAIRLIDVTRERDCEFDRTFTWLEAALRQTGGADV